MSEIFVKALKTKLRFNVNGNIATEDLFTVEYSQLEAYEQQLTAQVETFGKSTRRNSSYKTVAQQKAELQLAIVTAVLNELDADKAVSDNAAANKIHNQEVLELIKQKEKSTMAEMSIDDLKKLLR